MQFNKNNKEHYEPCIICGFDLYTENHHIKNKTRMIFVNRYGVVIMQFLYDDDLYNKLLNGYRNKEETSITEGFAHEFPNEYISLCANCHALYHKRKLSYAEIYNLYKMYNISKVIEESLSKNLKSNIALMNNLSKK